MRKPGLSFLDTNYLQALPPAVVDVALESTCNQALNATLEPHLPQQCVISLLIQEQLVVSAQCWIHFTMLVEIRSNCPGAVIQVEEENHAFANMDKEANLATASIAC